MEKLIRNLLILRLLDKYKTIWALRHVSSLANWDLETYMPEEGAKARGEALGIIETVSQKFFLEEEFVKLIELADKEENLNSYEKAVLRILKRSLKFYQKLPPEFIKEYAKATSEAFVAWRKAKDKNDFKTFEPYLEKIVDLSRRKAEYLGYSEHPYDALLDEYEEGLTVSETQAFFDNIKNPLMDLMDHIKKSKKFKHEHALKLEQYDSEKMKIFINKLVKFIHDNVNNLRIDTSPHPFSTNIGPGDQRITTRYGKDDFGQAYSSTIHEYGHALYELQSHEDLHYTPISGGNSLVIHESQSRFWENFIGRSREFLSFFKEDLDKTGSGMIKYSLEDIYQYLNLVRPSLIRTESDEVSYHFHIMIRFEIEKGLIEGKIKVKDVQEVWRQKYLTYLGIEPKNDSEGVLQDIHWAHGSFGYFPTYSFGTFLSAMWKHKMEKDLGSMDNILKSKNGISLIQKWLKENIHQYGSTYTFNELVRKTTGQEFDPSYLLDYLREKYKKLY